jgi:hypothetical protein
VVRNQTALPQSLVAHLIPTRLQPDVNERAFLKAKPNQTLKLTLVPDDLVPQKVPRSSQAREYMRPGDLARLHVTRDQSVRTR